MRSLLHVGVHKTGTTSIQQFLRDQVGEPRFPTGLFYPNAHNELAALALRPSRHDALHLVLGPRPGRGWRALAERHVRGLVESTDDLIISTEALSLLCHADEIDNVMSLLDGRVPEVVMYIRDGSSFLERYRVTIGLFGVPRLATPDAVTDVSPSSWLVDFEARADLWSRHCDVTVIDYDEVVDRDGSVIPSFASLIGVDAVEYRLNTTESLLEELAGGIVRSPEARRRFQEEMGRSERGATDSSTTSEE